jgi:hypothetical protein
MIRALLLVLVLVLPSIAEAKPRLVNASPYLAGDDSAYDGLVNSELSGELLFGDAAATELSADVSHHVFRQSGFPLALSYAGATTPLVDFVPHIVSITAKEQMRGVDARRVVAGMADEHAVRDRAIRDAPHDTMRPIGSPAVPNATVPRRRCDTARPHPTRLRSTRSVGIGFQFFSKGTKLRTHRRPPVSGCRAGGVTSTARHSAANSNTRPQREVVKVIDHTSAGWSPIVAVTELNAIMPPRGPILQYVRAEFGCASEIPVCSGDTGPDAIGITWWWVGESWGNILLTDYHSLSPLVMENVVCHEFLHALTHIGDNYGAVADSCVWGNLPDPGGWDIDYLYRYFGDTPPHQEKARAKHKKPCKGIANMKNRRACQRNHRR